MDKQCRRQRNCTTEIKLYKRNLSKMFNSKLYEQQRKKKNRESKFLVHFHFWFISKSQKLRMCFARLFVRLCVHVCCNNTSDEKEESKKIKTATTGPDGLRHWSNNENL